MHTCGVWGKAVLGFSLVGSVADRSAGVGHVVHQDSHAVLHITDKHHAVHFVCFFALFVNERKLHIQSVGNGGHPREVRTDIVSDTKIAGLTERGATSNQQGGGTRRQWESNTWGVEQR